MLVMTSLSNFENERNDDNLQDQRDEIFALQCILNTDDDEKLKVLSEVTEGRNGLFSLLISIHPKPVSEVIQIHVGVPAAHDSLEDLGAAAPAPAAASSPPSLARSVPLNRSISGQRWQGSFEVKYLSPLSLVATLPGSYPSNEPPVTHLTCDWLSTVQLQALETSFHQIWLEACNMPVIYTWVDWLENNCLEFLGITDQLTLRPSVGDASGDAGTEEFAPWEEDLGNTIAAMIRYNQDKQDEEFCQTVHLCEICYDEYPGTQFFRLNECSHAFCHTCVHDFCDLHVTAGTVEELRCPMPKCNTVVPPHIIQGVLPLEAYNRWEQLMLQKTLDAMEDTVYCPRCGTVVIVEEDRDSNLAHCSACYFAFCTQCERAWHQGRNCETEEEILENLEKKDVNSMAKAVRAKYEELRRKMEEEIANKAIKIKSTRPCPSCKIPVEKIGGCNKMTCKCGQIFCWICGKAIEGYSHFRQGKCELFPGQNAGINNVRARGADLRRRPDAVLRMQAMIAINPNLADHQCRCPMCKQKCLKGQDRNNHIKCWNCKTNFCFVCKQRILGPISDHFTGPCDHHS